MTRLYNSYDTWEDLKHNFYGGAGTFEKEGVLERCADLLKSQNRFSAALYTIIYTWKHSCEHNLTNEDMNRIEYLVQAACALIYNVPHNVSISAYNLLSANEQKVVNASARAFLHLWITKHKETEK